MKVRTLILAAGKGTRMKSNLVKVLHDLRGRPMLSYVVEATKEAGSERLVVVVGYQAEAVKERFREKDLIFIEQREQLGTGHAVLQAGKLFENYEGAVLITCGDVPLLKSSTLRTMLEYHRLSGAKITVMTTIVPDPSGYGRIIKGRSGKVEKIVEQRDATERERKIKEINTGIYCAESRFLFEALKRVKNNNAQKEYYLTDIVAIARENGCEVGTYLAEDYREVMGINTPEEMEKANRYLNESGEAG